VRRSWQFAFRNSMRRSAFTLIELLVVVAIIALLLAILLPSLREARRQTREVKCRTQLREFARGFQYYLTEFRDIFPAADYGPDGEEIRQPTWFELVERFWRGHEADAATDQASGRALGLGRCPDLSGQRVSNGLTWSWDYDWRTFGYGYNRIFLGYNRFDLPAAEVGPNFRPKFWRPLREVRNVAECLLVGDSVVRQLPNYNGLNQAGHYLGWRGIVTLGAGVDTRHGATDDEPTVASTYGGDTAFYSNGRGNIGWVDGHVAARKSTEINDVVRWRRFWDPEQNVGGY
jgi:prepilin-type N-terminal cleavage/methylation domain-containing protein/prepilin-type processing-associated H-X9-DG protein